MAAHIAFRNLVPTTIGNIIGSALVALSYGYVHARPEQGRNDPGPRASPRLGLKEEAMESIPPRMIVAGFSFTRARLPRIVGEEAFVGCFRCQTGLPFDGPQRAPTQNLVASFAMRAPFSAARRAF